MHSQEEPPPLPTSAPPSPADEVSVTPIAPVEKEETPTVSEVCVLLDNLSDYRTSSLSVIFHLSSMDFFVNEAKCDFCLRIY